MSTAVAVAQNGHVATQQDFTNQQLELIRHAIVPGATPLEFDMFLNLCRAKRLDPLTRQIYGIKTSKGMQMFASIDGLRVIAQRSGQYAGQVGPFWCGEDGKWQDVWLSDKKPAASKIGVLRKGWTEPMWGVATLKSYGKDSPTWNAMPDVMLAKVAESMALRKAFPDDLSALYVREEFDTPDAPEMPVTASPASEKPSKPAPVVAEVVDADTGEIRDWNKASKEEVAKAIADSVQYLGWTEQNLTDFSAKHGIRQTKAGSIQLAELLTALVEAEEAQRNVERWEQEDNDEDDEPAQGTLLDAETAPIGRTPWDD